MSRVTFAFAVLFAAACCQTALNVWGIYSEDYVNARLAIIEQSMAQQRLNEKLVKRVLAIEQSLTKRVTVTAYTPRAQETDSTPNLTAIQRRVRPGTVAVSPDLLAQGWTFGRKVYIEGIGVLVIGDLMHHRWENSMDILLFDLKAARKFGRKLDRLAILLKEEV